MFVCLFLRNIFFLYVLKQILGNRIESSTFGILKKKLAVNHVHFISQLVPKLWGLHRKADLLFSFLADKDGLHPLHGQRGKRDSVYGDNLFGCLSLTGALLLGEGGSYDS